MTQYRFTPHALSDLFDIWSYIAQDNLEGEIASRRQSTRPVKCLRAHRLPGVRKDLTTLPVRFWLVPQFPNYFVVYDPGAKPLEVIRILHRARNIPSMLP